MVSGSVEAAPIVRNDQAGKANVSAEGERTAYRRRCWRGKAMKALNE